MISFSLLFLKDMLKLLRFPSVFAIEQFHTSVTLIRLRIMRRDRAIERQYILFRQSREGSQAQSGFSDKECISVLYTSF